MPQEIIDMVIDHLVESRGWLSAADKRALAACALVCRSWVPRSRHHLFRRIVLDNRVTNFTPLLRSENCTFAPNVRHITAFRTHTDPGDHHFDKIGKDLKRLTNVTKLMLDGMFHACAPWADFMSGFPKVTDLSVLFHLTGNSNCVFGMIHMLPALRRLDITPLSPVVFWTGKPPPPSIDIPPQYLTPPRHLHSIKTGAESTRHIFAWLKWYNCLKQIDELDLSALPPADVLQVIESLRVMSRNLHHLKLSSEILLSYETVHRFELTTLGLPKLNKNAQDATAYDQFLKFILRISSPSLESVVFIHPGNGYKLMDWAAVDAFFASPDFARLRTVQVQPSPREYFEGKLPRLHELGVLKITGVYLKDLLPNEL
ncbi:hypothetical protein DFH06DRAFT_1465919 [Mycena polygramma]|nr:hypothetical protein DFH06DRAFT_1465919 [Mycena polygramma]